MKLRKNIIIAINLMIMIIMMLAIIFRSDVNKVITKINTQNTLADGNNLSFNLIATPEEKRVKSGETVTIQLTLSDINVGEQGLNSIVGFF
ncbi:MAG TPA: hypothetical protein PK993_05885, partial [Clostridia bacterium]|nr:hypothetical protein [Clostridia bacterium]